MIYVGGRAVVEGWAMRICGPKGGGCGGRGRMGNEQRVDALAMRDGYVATSSMILLSPQEEHLQNKDCRASS